MPRMMVNRKLFVIVCVSSFFCAGLIPAQQPPAEREKAKQERTKESEKEREKKKTQGESLGYYPPANALIVKGTSRIKTRTLDEMVAAAMANNPDINVAEAKLREAEAELNRLRLQISQKVTALQRKIETQKALLQNAERSLFEAPDTLRKRDAEDKLITAKAQLADLEAELPYLLGQREARQARGERVYPVKELIEPVKELIEAEQIIKLWEQHQQLKPMDLYYYAKVQPAVRGSMADRIRKALDTPVTVDYKNKTPEEILKDLEKKFGVPFRIKADFHTAGAAGKMNLHFDEALPLGAVMQAFQDLAPEVPLALENNQQKYGSVSFIVRDYGILVFAGRKEELPEGAIYLSEFWKSTPRAEGHKDAAPADKQKPNAPRTGN